eukprot:12914560-Prorocentrum_lima.AAC.1
MICHKHPEYGKKGERYLFNNYNHRKESPRIWVTGGQDPLGSRSNMSLRSFTPLVRKQYLIAH